MSIITNLTNYIKTNNSIEDLVYWIQDNGGLGGITGRRAKKELKKMGTIVD